MTRQWRAPGLRRLCGDDAILAQAALELRLCEKRQSAFGLGAVDRAWMYLVGLFLAQSGQPAGDVSGQPGAAGSIGDLERRGLICRDDARTKEELQSMRLTSEGMKQLRAHFGVQLLNEMALCTRFSAGAADSGDEAALAVS